MLKISWIICVTLYMMLYDFLFCKLICQKEYKLRSKNLIFYIIGSIIQFIIMNTQIEYLRPYIMHVIAIIILKIIYNEKIVKTVLGVVFCFMITAISEFIFGILFVLILNQNGKMLNEIMFFWLSNIFIIIMDLIFSKVKIVKNIVNNIIKWTNENEYKSSIIISVAVFGVLTFFLYNAFTIMLPRKILWIVNLFAISIFIFIVGFFKEKTNKNKLSYEYDQLLDYVKTYEKLLDEKNKNQHEYKNQLAVIKLMCNNKKTMNYIDSLLNNEKEENLDTLNKLRYIPKGGLKGLIYYKIEFMKKNKINVFVNVSKELSIKNIWKRCDSSLEEVTKVLGVYLDNAIEASIDTLDKIITLDIYLDDKNIVFEISNTFSNEINMDKIDNEGFTTKGSGKGYGLALVKDILKNNNYLNQEREIIGNYYIQKLIVKK